MKTIQKHAPSGDGVEERLRHSDQFGVTNSMYSSTTRRARNNIDFSNCITLTIFAYDGYSPIFSLRYCTKSTIDNDIEAVAGLFRPPEYLAGVNLHPVQRCIDMKHYRMLEKAGKLTYI